MILDLSKLPEWVKLEVTKGDLIIFAQSLLAQNKSQMPTPSVSNKKILTVDDLVKYLDMARQTIYGLTSKGKIPHHKAPDGRKVYFVQAEIDEWLTSNRRATSAEIEAQAKEHIQQQKLRRAKR